MATKRATRTTKSAATKRSVKRPAAKAVSKRSAQKRVTKRTSSRAVVPKTVKSTTSEVARAKPARKAKAATPTERLAKYRAMRDFERTPEPSSVRAARPHEGCSFVVQKHDASHLHYDFRLEHAGVLLSWSIPKGPSLRAGERRLAVRTEDHPLSYADFEGIIPQGEYGGGTVIVWDRGSWAPDGDAEKLLAKGKLTFTLQGEKLRGRFHLVRTRQGNAKQEQWLLFKGNDDAASDIDIVSERAESVLSGRTIEDVADTPGRVWHSNRGSQKKPVVGKGEQLDVTSLVSRLPVQIKFSNLDKVLFPEAGIRKADIIAYYAAVSSRIMPHLRDRPLTLVRCPSGRQAHCFFQKHANEGVPDAVKRIPISEDGKTEYYMAVEDLDGLLALPQLGALELHTWPAHADDPELPDQFVFDLDPDPTIGWDAVVEAALRMRDALAALELTSFVKTTGGKGLHVVLPVERKHSWDTHRAFAKGIADTIARAHPNRYLTNMRKDLRKGKLFLDYLRNGRGATAVAPYSTRAREGATVATPISWDELERGVDPKAFTIRTMMKRLDATGADPWAAYGSVKQALGARQLRAVGVKP